MLVQTRAYRQILSHFSRQDPDRSISKSGIRFQSLRLSRSVSNLVLAVFGRKVVTGSQGWRRPKSQRSSGLLGAGVCAFSQCYELRDRYFPWCAVSGRDPLRSLGDCRNGTWRAIEKGGSWTFSMSPFQEKYVDIRVTKSFSAPAVTVSVQDGMFTYKMFPVQESSCILSRFLSIGLALGIHECSTFRISFYGPICVGKLLKTFVKDVLIDHSFWWIQLIARPAGLIYDGDDLEGITLS